jgi:hypothetical protein
MKRIMALYLAGCIGAAAVLGFSQQSRGIVGIWQGVLEVPGTELRLVFKISQKADGSLSATLDSLDQGASNIPVKEVIYKEGQVEINMPNLQAHYEGSLSEDGTKIKGKFTQRGMTFPLDLKRTDKAPQLSRPQEPKKPYPYDEKEVTYRNERDDIKLAATLTLPREDGPFPAVVLISGSGAQDRNEAVFGHKPFLVLADYLTRRGIVVLRADDRGVGGSSGKITEATSENFAFDALAGVEFLKSNKKIDPENIGLIGHSEGGIIAPLAAVKSSDVAFIVLLAGTGLPGEEILYLQGELIAKAGGVPEDRIKKNREIQEKIFSIVKKEKDINKAKEELRQLIPETLKIFSEDEKQEMGDVEKVMQVQMESVLSPWFKHFLTYDPRPTLKKVQCPVLAVNGELDLQVPPEENLEAIEAMLKEGGNKDYTVKEFPGLNHLFQPAETGSPSEYGKIEETMSPEVLEYIADWILARTK